MPETTQSQRTDIKVPPGTVSVLEEHVLGPHTDRPEHGSPGSNFHAAHAAWKGLKPAPRAHYLRYDLSDAGDRAGAVWLFFELQRLRSSDPHTLETEAYEKLDVLGRIASELYQALRSAEVVGVEA